jgi:two-component system CheB/CheR fusion protein
LQRNVDELDEANNNLRNLFEVSEIATIILDRNLLVRSFTPATRGLFNLMDINRGRPLTDIVTGLADLDLRQEIAPGLATGQTRSRRIVSRDGGANYLMRVLPYRRADRSIDGVLVTFTDITRIVEAEAHEQELRRGIDTMPRNV